MAEFKEIVEKSKKALDELENKVEDISEDLTQEAKELWSDLKKKFSGVGEKLKDGVKEEKDELKANLDVIEARQKLHDIKESAEEFTKKIASKAEEELDIAALRAHLAKMEAEDLWEEKKKELSYEFQESKHKVEKMAKEAAEEIEEYFTSLMKNFTDEGKKA